MKRERKGRKGKGENGRRGREGPRRSDSTRGGAGPSSRRASCNSSQRTNDSSIRVTTEGKRGERVEGEEGGEGGKGEGREKVLYNS